MTAIKLHGAAAVCVHDPIPVPAKDEPLTRVVAIAYETAIAATLCQDDDVDPGQAQRTALDAVAAVARHTTRGEAQAAFSIALTGRELPPDDLAALLDEVTGGAEQAFHRFHDAGYTGADLPAPMIELTNLLAVVAGARAVLGLSPSRTARAITAADVTTPAADPLRAHLLSAHGELGALDATDRIAELIHDHAHPRRYTTNARDTAAGRRGHTPGDLSWDEARCREIIEAVPEPDGREIIESALNAVLARIDQEV